MQHETEQSKAKSRQDVLVIHWTVHQIFDETDESLDDFSVQPTRMHTHKKWMSQHILLRRNAVVSRIMLRSFVPVHFISDNLWIFANILDFHQVWILKHTHTCGTQ